MKMRRWVQISILAACLFLIGCGQPELSGGQGEAAVSTEHTDAAAAVSAVSSVVQTAADPQDASDAPEDAAEEPAAGPEAARADWWTYPVIAHALGTVDGRKETNSLDAFLESYEAGQRVFEVDLQLTSDGHLVARHDWDHISYYNLEQKFADVMDWATFQKTPICFFYTPVDIERIVSLMQEYPDVYFVTDSKDTSEDTVRAQIREISRAIQAAGDPSLWEQIIVQLYHEDMYTWVSEEAPVTNWIFTLYQILTPDYHKIGAFCRDHNIPVVTISSERLSTEHVEILHSYDRLIYVHTINRLRTMLEMSWGADGFYSDYVAPDELREVLAGTNQMYLSKPADKPQEAQAPQETPDGQKVDEQETTENKKV